MFNSIEFQYKDFFIVLHVLLGGFYSGRKKENGGTSYI